MHKTFNYFDFVNLYPYMHINFKKIEHCKLPPLLSAVYDWIKFNRKFLFTL
jgi:hypothetical protein